MCCLCCVGSLEGDRTRTGNFVGKGKVLEKELSLMVGQASLRHSIAEGAGRPEAVEVEMEMEIIRAQRPMRQQSRQAESIRD
jgi:hypothetical protein